MEDMPVFLRLYLEGLTDPQAADVMAWLDHRLPFTLADELYDLLASTHPNVPSVSR